MTTIKERIEKLRAKHGVNPVLMKSIIQNLIQPQLTAMLLETTKKWLLKKEMRSIHVVHREGGEIDVQFLEPDGTPANPFPEEEDDNRSEVIK